VSTDACGRESDVPSILEGRSFYVRSLVYEMGALCCGGVGVALEMYMLALLDSL
jgi:hypothetical protein